MKRKVALIAVQSPELTKAISKRYAHEKYNVIILHRDLSLLEQTDDEIQSLGHATTLVPFMQDETETQDSCVALLDSLCNSIEGKFNVLDVLVLGFDIKEQLCLTIDHSYKSFQDNLFHAVTLNWLLIKTFDKLLKRSENGRLILARSGLIDENNISSFWSLYNIVEDSLVKLVKVYARENLQSNIKANIINPGIIKSLAYSRNYPGKPTDNLPDVDKITDVFVKLSSSSCQITGAEHNAQY
ncbi:SDR family NAD(P)-dependent oxidoreductase [Anaplasmataceae bacterium AB001_6]|nr:SDR family NAD(P)-dependent oxidoreductase [Anaplasmataceae bacterium AB001_6]